MRVVSANINTGTITNKRSFIEALKNNRTLLLMCMPAMLFVLIFAYIPMPGVYIAFVKFSYSLGIFKSPFCGLDNFRFLIISGDLLRLTKNTILYNLIFILLGNTLQITFALLMNEIGSKWFRKVSQTLIFLPHFISYVIVGLFAYNILNYEHGMLNSILKSLGIESVKTYSNSAVWPFIIVFTYLWHTTGYGTIIYFATIMGIDSEIIEASEIDGANAVQRIRYIMLPNMKPTFVILLLYAVGGILKGNFGLIYNLVGSSNALLFQNTDVIETFVFRALMNNFNFSMGSAVGLYQSLFGFILIMSVNWLVRKLEPEYSLF